MSAVRIAATPMAWLIAPSALLFALFFFLPMGLMAMISLLTGNPVVQPNVTFTAKHYQRIVGEGVLLPSLLLLQAPIFHGYAFAIHLQMEQIVDVEQFSQGLGAFGVRLISDLVACAPQHHRGMVAVPFHHRGDVSLPPFIEIPPVIVLELMDFPCVERLIED